MTKKKKRKKPRKKPRIKFKDKLTRDEGVEFIVGIIMTLFFGGDAIERIHAYMPLERAFLLLVITVVVCIGFLWLRGIHEVFKRIATVTLLSLMLVPVFYFLLFGIDVREDWVLYFATVTPCIIGALTIDILRED